MSAPFGLPQGDTPTDPSLADLLALHKKDINLSLNCHHIGTVQSFDESNQTASVLINYKKTRFELNKVTGTYNAVLVDYPMLVDCPVVVLGGGGVTGGSITFPIKSGDECLVLFNDRDIDNWFQGAPNGAVATPRLHSLSDGIALVGVRSLPNVLPVYDTARAVLQYGTTMVGVSDTLVKIANQQFTLNTLLQELIVEVQNLVTQTAAITVTNVTPSANPSDISGLPVNAAAITAIGVQITATALKISELLE